MTSINSIQSASSRFFCFILTSSVISTVQALPTQMPVIHATDSVQAQSKVQIRHSIPIKTQIQTAFDNFSYEYESGMGEISVLLEYDKIAGPIIYDFTNNLLKALNCTDPVAQETLFNESLAKFYADSAQLDEKTKAYLDSLVQMSKKGEWERPPHADNLWS